MTVSQLKDILKPLNLKLNGKKNDLISRIVLNRPIPPSVNDPPPPILPDALPKQSQTQVLPLKKRKCDQLNVEDSKRKVRRLEMNDLSASTALFLRDLTTDKRQRKPNQRLL